MKVGIDTNVLVRWLVASDSTDQADRADAALAGNELHLSSIVVAETIWVLSRTYRFSRQQISEVVRSLLDLSNLTIDRSEALRNALAEFELHAGDFNDHLIAAHDHAAGCQYTLTFDKKAARSKRFKAI